MRRKKSIKYLTFLNSLIADAKYFFFFMWLFLTWENNGENQVANQRPRDV